MNGGGLLRRYAAVPVLAGLVASAAGAAAQPSGLEKPRDVGSAVEQPFRDLNLVRDEIPPVLRESVRAPYALETPPACPDVAGQIAALDAVLGADVDETSAKSSQGGALAGELVRGVVGLPFSGIIRNLTGAAARERDARRAIVAGIARRSFLKGVALTLNCEAPAPAQP